MIKFVHMADLHLDSPFSALSMEERKKERDRQRDALSSVVSYCLNNGTDLLLIAGDLFDGDFVRRDTAVFVSECFAKIPDTRVFIAPGNHDSYGASSPYKYCSFPDNVHIFTEETLENVEIPTLGCAVYGFGYRSDRVREDPVAGIKPNDRHRINILIAHGDLDTPGSGYYNIKSSDLAASGLDYAALGHIHKPSGIMYFGGTACAYSGCLVGRDFGECGKRGMIAGEISENGVKARYVPVSSATFEEISVDISGTDMETVTENIRGAVSDFDMQSRIRIVLFGEREYESGEYERSIRNTLSDFGHIEINDRSREKIIYGELLKEYSLRGAFARNLKPYLESEDEYTREKAYIALRYGLEALKK